jgi:hypothetical protein
LIALFQIRTIRLISSPLSVVISRLEVSFHCACELVMLTLQTRIWNTLISCSITHVLQLYLCAAHTKLPRWYNGDNNWTARGACRKVAPAPHVALGSRAEKITKVHSRCVGRQGSQQVFVDSADSEDAMQKKQCQVVPGRDSAVRRPRSCID